MITTKTVDLLASIAHKLNAISTAVYEQGWREEAREIETAAYRIAISSASIDGKIAACAAAMMKDDPA